MRHSSASHKVREATYPVLELPAVHAYAEVRSVPARPDMNNLGTITNRKPTAFLRKDSVATEHHASVYSCTFAEKEARARGVACKTSIMI